MSPTRRRPAARKRDDGRGLWISARLWRVELATAAAAFLTYATYGLPYVAAIALLVGLPLAAVHIADGAHHRPGWRRRIGWHPYGWPRAVAQRTVSATLRQAGRRLPRPYKWLDELAQVGHAIARPYANQQLRRHWWHALAAANLPQARVKRITATRAGARFDLTMPAGCPAGHLDDYAEHIATTLRARQVRVHRDPANAARAVADISYRDPFPDANPWPPRHQTRHNLWDGVPVGLNEDGNPLTVPLVENNMLVGGIPGAGKSNFLSMIVAAAALDPNTRLWLSDAKGKLELGRWQQSAEQVAGTIDEAIAILELLHAYMQDRYVALGERGARKITPGDGLPVHLFALDEIADFTTHRDRRKRERFNSLLTELIRKGRALGIIVVAATQRPSAKTIPTDLRANVSLRVAFRTTDGTTSDMILGEGHAANGTDASTVPNDQRGGGFLLADGEHPARFRAYHVTDPDLDELVARAAEQCPAQHGATPPSAPRSPCEEVLGEREEFPTASPVGARGESPQRPGTPHPGADNRDESATVADLPAPLRVVPEPIAGERRTAKQAMVEAAVLESPELSDRELGRRCGVDNKTVAAARRRLGISR